MQTPYVLCSCDGYLPWAVSGIDLNRAELQYQTWPVGKSGVLFLEKKTKLKPTKAMWFYLPTKPKILQDCPPLFLFIYVSNFSMSACNWEMKKGRGVFPRKYLFYRFSAICIFPFFIGCYINAWRTFLSLDNYEVVFF